MYENNNFVCRGKLSGVYNKRATPGGVLLEDALIAVKTKTPWKQEKIMHIEFVFWGDLLDKLEKLKTGDNVKVAGFVEQVGTKEKRKINLIATQIEKEN